MLKIAIIGSGATAAAVHLAISDSFGLAKEITLFTPLAANTEDSKSDSDDPFTKMNSKYLKVLESSFTHSDLVNAMSGSSNFGGWTKFWGATMMPWHPKIFKEQNLEIADFNQAYTQLSKIIPQLASPDALLQKFPIYGASIPKRTNPLAQTFVSESSNLSDLLIGNSRLAIDGYGESMSQGCTDCGECLRGCPGDHIWNAARYFKQSNPDTEIVDSWVKSIEILPLDVGVRIHYSDKLNKMHHGDFDRVFLAAGALSTSQVLLNSKLLEKAVIRDSPVTIVPFISTRFKKFSSTPRITLSEMFISLNQNQKSSQHIFMQCYGMSSDLTNRILLEKPFLKIIPKRVLRYFLNRVAIAMIFQDMEYGGEILVSKSTDGSVHLTELAHRSKLGVVELRSALKKLKKVRMFPLWSFRHTGRVGEGYHFGASITQKDYDVDKNGAKWLGTLSDSKRLHIVDSSVLPVIPCYPTTYTTMANAYRITKHVMQLEILNVASR